MGLLNGSRGNVVGLLSGFAEQGQKADPRKQMAQLAIPIPIPGPRYVPIPPLGIPPWLQRGEQEPPIVPPDEGNGRPSRKSGDQCEWEYEKNMALCRLRYSGAFDRQFGRCARGAMNVFKECLAGRSEPPFNVEDYADWRY